MMTARLYHTILADIAHLWPLGDLELYKYS